MSISSHVDDAPASARGHARRGDRGFTLVETVVTITLMVVLILPIMQAVQTSIAASSRTRSAAQVETAIVNAADRVNRAPKKCDYTNYARAAVLTQGWYTDAADYDRAAKVTHEWYDVPTKTWMSKPAGSAAPACPGSGVVVDALLVQRVTVTITTPDGQASRTIQVVKSDV